MKNKKIEIEYDLYFIRLRNRIEGLKIHIARTKQQLKCCNIEEINTRSFLENELKSSYEILKEFKEEYNEAR